MQNMEEIYKQHSNAVYKYLFCLTHSEDTSEELTQETFAIAVKEIKKFKGNCKISVWLCQIAKHLWYKKLKKEKKEKSISFDELNFEIVENETTEEIICKQEENLKLFKDIQKLDSVSKEIIYLRIFGNLSFIETGEITKMLNKDKVIKNTQFGQNFDLISKLGKAFYSSIHTSYRDIGREYYVINNIFDRDSNYEEWIDKDTGLPLKIFGNGIIKTFFEGTDIVKEEIEMCHQYKYEFNNVTDEDVSIPDYTGYEVEYRTN